MLQEIPIKTQQQRKNEQHTIDVLVNARWQRTQRSKVFNIADFTYQNAWGIELAYHYYWQDDCVNLEIKSDQGLLYLVIYMVVQIQDIISPQTYQEVIRQILLVCPSVFVNMGKELVPVVLE